jgi:alpha-L-arabinofuranosidase
VPAEKLTAGDIWNAWVAVPSFDGNGLSVLPREMTESARKAGAKVAVTEWNWNGHWGNGEIRGKAALDSLWAKGVGAAGYLHALMRAGDVVQIGCQSMLVGVSWDIAAIQADPSGEKPARLRPTGAMTTFYGQHHGDRLLAMESENVPTYAQPYIMRVLSPAAKVAVVDALATRSDDRLFFHTINRSFDKSIDVAIDLTAFKGIAEKGKLYLVEGRLNNEPKPGEPDEIACISESAVGCENGVVRVTLPERSVGCVEVGIRR